MPGCHRDHTVDQTGDGLLCCSTAGRAPARTECGEIVDVEIGLDRYVPDAGYEHLATPVRITLDAGGYLFALTGQAARDLGWMLLGLVDQVERGN